MVDADEEWDYGEEGENNMEWEPSQNEFQQMQNQQEVNKNHKVMKLADIKPDIIDTIKRSQEMYNLSEDNMYLVAKHYRWNVENMQQWFEAQEKLQYTLGLVPTKGMENKKDLNMSRPENLRKEGNVCLICYEQLSSNNQFSLSCLHTFCKDCWKEHLLEQLNSDSDMTVACCMQTGCNMKLPHSKFLAIIEEVQQEAKTRFAPNKNKQLVELYWKWMGKSFTDSNINIKWCPQLGCEFFFHKSIYDESTTVKCECGMHVCLYCSEEAHGPCDCYTKKSWDFKSKSESENIKWIMANTKACPNPSCRRAIEKNQGCNHMQCHTCKWNFCWVCLGKWEEHGSASGGYYKCNKYDDKLKNDKGLQKEVSDREAAQNELRRYQFYFERFQNHEKSQKFATTQRPLVQNKVHQLNEIKHYPIQELEFLTEAVDTVKGCRGVLKWSYAFGYYTELQMQDKQRYEFWQEDLEKFCDDLQGLIEKPLDEHLDPNVLDRSDFYKFKGKLNALSTATQKHHESLVMGLEELAILPQPEFVRRMSSKNSSKGK